MAAVPIQIDGVLWDHANKSGRKVSLIGSAHILGLSVGGGPIMPPDTTPPGNGLHPEHPIVPPGGYPHPEHPIVMPPDQPPTEPPTGTPDDDGFIKTPPPDGGWAFHQQYHWLYSPGPSAPGPKK
jgi:hypothetical protein